MTGRAMLFPFADRSMVTLALFPPAARRPSGLGALTTGMSAARVRRSMVRAGAGRARKLALEQLFYVFQKLQLLRRHQGDRLAGQAGAARAADAVHVVFGRVRQLVVDNERQ